ncbi:phosphate ABC transporter substrate-binding protein PstS [Streptacidiphilus monticola]|uniref:Phosphate ABC transporter substrate-binding protein PstS n=1 Tax=Streptacidiphilus monticola TaxID=2161674 RepID=A0ABW1G4Q9_9ACTN
MFRRILGVLLPALLLGGFAVAPASASGGYTPVSGAGSTWAYNAVDQWRRDVKQYGMQVNYSGTGSSDGRHQFLNGTQDFAVSDIPFQTNPTDGSAPEKPTAGTYAYMPIVAGGTAFMYHLTIGGRQVTDLRLSGTALTKVFTGAAAYWDDPAIKADNPGLQLPHEKVVPVVRSDGSGSSAQFTLWMAKQQTALWQAYCAKVGRANACGETSYYPTSTGMIAQSGDLGVAGYISQSYGEGAIGYVNYSYALNAHYPVAKILNRAGYYTEPTPDNVAVSLLKAQINNDRSSADYLTQQLDGVYSDGDPRTYILSSYSYMILPLAVQGTFTTAKGRTLGAFSYYFLCQGQQEAPNLGYSPLPINLVQAGFEQIRKIPGVVAQNINIQGCNNPTFSASGVNKLATDAPQPAACDKQGSTQCTTPTGGAPGARSGSGGSGTGGGSASSGGSGTGGSGTAGGATAGAGSAGGSGSTGTGGTAGTSGGAGGSATGAAGTTVGTGKVDPDTGQQVSANSGASGGGTPVLASPVAVDAPGGWTGTQTLMLLAAVTLLALILAPALTARLVGAKSDEEKDK